MDKEPSNGKMVINILANIFITIFSFEHSLCIFFISWVLGITKFFDCRPSHLRLFKTYYVFFSMNLRWVIAHLPKQPFHFMFLFANNIVILRQNENKKIGHRTENNWMLFYLNFFFSKFFMIYFMKLMI